MQLSPQAFPLVQTLKQPAASVAFWVGAEFAGADIAGAVVDIKHSMSVAITSFHIAAIYCKEYSVARVNTALSYLRR